MITPYRLPFNTPNYTEIDISPGCDYWAESNFHHETIKIFLYLFLLSVKRAINIYDVYEMITMSFWQSKTAYQTVGYATSLYALNHTNVQKFLRADKHYYDLILVEQYYQDVFLMLSHELKAPIVSIC